MVIRVSVGFCSREIEFFPIFGHLGALCVMISEGLLKTGRKDRGHPKMSWPQLLKNLRRAIVLHRDLQGPIPRTERPEEEM